MKRSVEIVDAQTASILDCAENERRQQEQLHTTLRLTLTAHPPAPESAPLIGMLRFECRKTASGRTSRQTTRTSWTAGKTSWKVVSNRALNRVSAMSVAAESMCIAGVWMTASFCWNH